MTQNQNQPQSTDKSNQKPQGNSMPQEIPANDATKPTQQPAPQAVKAGKDAKNSSEQSSKSPADAAAKMTANDTDSSGSKKA